MPGMNISNHKVSANSIIQNIEFVAGKMTLLLRDGKSFQIPLAKHPKLASASILELNDWQISAAGKGVYWPQIDEDLSIAGLLRDIN
jgi:hypothetical protein